MAKTPLNEKLDSFFKKYEKTSITEKIYEANGFDIREVNDYGNLLHGAVNYDYDPNRITEFIDILLKKGIDVNYKGKNTGLTFIHLALYGYTDASGKDHPYHEDFISDLIKKARQYGLDVNIKDRDGDDIPTCAVASEVYRGSVLKVIEALGTDYQLPEDFLDTYHKYLKEAKNVNKGWYDRLNKELTAVTDYVNKSHLNIDELNNAIKEKKDSLTNETSNLDYEKLTSSYEVIHNLIEEIKKYLSKRTIFEIDNSEDENYLENIMHIIENLLNKELDSLEKNPKQKSLETLKSIATCFNLADIIKRAEEIIESYKEYLDTLRNKAKEAKTINECQGMSTQIKESEIFEELNAILEGIIASIKPSIEAAKDSYREVKKAGDIASSFIEITDISEKQNYDDSTVEELNAIIEANKSTIKEYQASLKDRVSSMYQELFLSLSPLLDNNLLSQEDIENIFAKTSKDEKKKAKKK